MKRTHRRKRSYLVMFNLAVIGIVIAVAVSTSVLLVSRMYRAGRQDAIDGLNSDLSQVDQTLSSNIEALFNVTNQLADDAQLSTAVEQYYGAPLSESVQGRKMILYILRNALELSANAESISLLCGERTFQVDRYGQESNTDLAGMTEAPWYGQLLRDEIPFAFGLNTDFVRQGLEETEYYFCAAKFKSKFYLDRSEENRIVAVTFRLDARSSGMSEIASQYNINLLLCDGDGSCLCRAGADPAFLERTDSATVQPEDLAALSEDFVSVERVNALSGWRLYGFVRQTDFAAMVQPLQGGLATLLFLLLLVEILLSVAVVRNISKPLERVVQGMEDLGNQDFYALEHPAQYWEIDRLVTTFNQMSRRIQELIANIEQKEQEKRKMEFQVLENQINPHFIYNTLDAARWVALMNQDKAVAEMVGALSRLLRIALSGGRELIPVRQEMALTQEYARIMVFRNNASIDFHYEMEPGVEDLLTLKMVLQPLVENCFVHAFPAGQVQARVDIRCSRREDRLVMTVRDNGSGLLDRPETPRRDPRLTGIGLHNIEERLRLWYGSGFGLTISSPPSGGTTVVITQPLQREEGGVEHDTGPAGGG